MSIRCCIIDSDRVIATFTMSPFAFLWNATRINHTFKNKWFYWCKTIVDKCLNNLSYFCCNNFFFITIFSKYYVTRSVTQKMIKRISFARETRVFREENDTEKPCLVCFIKTFIIWIQSFANHDLVHDLIPDCSELRGNWFTLGNETFQSTWSNDCLKTIWFLRKTENQYLLRTHRAKILTAVCTTAKKKKKTVEYKNNFSFLSFSIVEVLWPNKYRDRSELLLSVMIWKIWERVWFFFFFFQENLQFEIEISNE